MTGVLERLVGAFLAGDREAAASCLSPDFGLHDGLSADAYLDRECRDFGIYSRHWDFSSGFRVVPLMECPAGGGLRFAVLDSAARLVYEDCLPSGPDGLVVGSGRPFEAVTKLCLDRSGLRRGVALRLPDSRRPSWATVYWAGAEDQRLSDRDHNEDGFFHFSFRSVPDDGAGRPAGIWVAPGLGPRLKSRVYFRGTDHPFFALGLRPVVRGDTVVLDTTRTVWLHLSVRLQSGETRDVLFPAAETRFPHPVVSATATDALDNDWTAEGAVP
jgi:hypothetical protein